MQEYYEISQATALLENENGDESKDNRYVSNSIVIFYPNPKTISLVTLLSLKYPIRHQAPHFTKWFLKLLEKEFVRFVTLFQ